ncbi:hypothetical protein HYV70_01360 [Candidatus Uhrbacteria bacterium]|nr:hypothetical protein [Candidatus Uhrbacteria bacterium]
MFKYGKWLETIVNRFRGKSVVSKPAKRWREVDGVIYLTVVSDGTSGEACTCLEQNNVRLSADTKSVLHSSGDFKHTNGILYEIAILKGDRFLGMTRDFYRKAGEMEFTIPNAEVVCLIRKNFTDKEIAHMGLGYIVVMRQFGDFDGKSKFLAVGRGGSLFTCEVYPCHNDVWPCGGGFAFLAPSQRDV